LFLSHNRLNFDFEILKDQMMQQTSWNCVVISAIEMNYEIQLLAKSKATIAIASKLINWTGFESS
jgi:hypothetical protein